MEERIIEANQAMNGLYSARYSASTFFNPLDVLRFRRPYMTLESSPYNSDVVRILYTVWAEAPTTRKTLGGGSRIDNGTSNMDNEIK